MEAMTDRSDTAGHAPVTTLEDLDALDEAEMVAGHLSAQWGDPEPGMNHSRSWHHGWRTRMMDFNEIPVPPEHRQLINLWLDRERTRRGQR
jgi:hypothetical protein